MTACSEGEGKPSAAEVLANIATAEAELWHDPTLIAFATVRTIGQFEGDLCLHGWHLSARKGRKRRKQRNTYQTKNPWFPRGFRVAAVGFEPTISTTNPLQKQALPPADQLGCTPGCTSTTAPPASTPPDLLQLLAQLASLSADQRALVSKLLNPPATPTEPPAGLDDSLPHGFEQPKGETG